MRRRRKEREREMREDAEGKAAEAEREMESRTDICQDRLRLCTDTVLKFPGEIIHLFFFLPLGKTQFWGSSLTVHLNFTALLGSS